jgi:antitoxin HicB
MKEITLEQFARDLPGLTAAAQRERIVVTGNGKPLAILVGIENKDAEDLRLEASPDFWRMIEERRRRPTMPLKDLEAELQAGHLPLCRYSMLINWSEAEQLFVVSLPEFGECGKARGASYEEAAINGQEALDRLMEAYQAEGRPLPEPAQLGSSNSVVKGRGSLQTIRGTAPNRRTAREVDFEVQGGQVRIHIHPPGNNDGGWWIWVDVNDLRDVLSSILADPIEAPI